jgi:hypothetical protein
MAGRVGRSVAAGLAAALLASSPAYAADREPVRVGVLDMQAKRIVDQDADVKVVYREFLVPGTKAGAAPTASGRDHGEIVATSVVRELRSMGHRGKVELYAANAFQAAKDGTGYSMRYDKAVEALQWMHDNGVRVVVTSFNTKNENGSRFMMDRAEALGMTVFAGASNVAGAGKVFPAADPRSISVADTTPSGSSLTLDPSVQGWVKFAIRGDYADMSVGGKVVDWGSSYSSAKAGAYGAYYASRNPQAGRDEIENALKDASELRVQRHGKVQATMPTLGEGRMPERFVRIANAGAVDAARGSLSKGPAFAGVTDLPVIPGRSASR